MKSVNKFTGWLKQVRSLLFSIIGILPVFVLFLNAIEFIIYSGLIFFGFPDWAIYLGEILKQVNDISLMTLIMLFIMSKSYRWISKLAFCYLCLIWLTNTIYILSGINAQTYFYAFSSIIYITFVTLTVWKLKNR